MNTLNCGENVRVILAPNYPKRQSAVRGVCEQAKLGIKPEESWDYKRANRISARESRRQLVEEKLANLGLT